jgi:mono/diheme cytochrome c family protein
MIRAVVKGVAAVLVLLLAAAALLLIALQLGWARRHDAPYPPVRATTDAGVIARGRYLVYGPAACAYCHRPKADWPRLARGDTPPLSGSHEFPLPFGAILSSNLTSDRETGLGAASDSAIARVLRYGIKRDGHAAVPIMEFQNLSDDDLVAIVSFLRTQPAVRQRPPPHRLTFFGRLLLGVLLTPSGPSQPPPRVSPSGSTVARGRYLANDVAACVSCHTDRQRGTLVGPPFAGGQRMDFAGDSTRVLVPPNLTPEPTTGRVASWSEDVFVARFRQGPTIPETIMPWGAYSRMTDDDLRAIYRYLRSLPPTRRDTGAAVQPRRMGE